MDMFTKQIQYHWKSTSNAHITLQTLNGHLHHLPQISILLSAAHDLWQHGRARSCSQHHKFQTHLQTQVGWQHFEAFQQPVCPAQDAGMGRGRMGQKRRHCWSHDWPTRCTQGSRRGHCQRKDLLQVQRTPEKTMHDLLSFLSKFEPLQVSTLQYSSLSVAKASFITCFMTRASLTVNRNQWYYGKKHEAAGTGLSIKVPTMKQWNTCKGNLNAIYHHLPHQDLNGLLKLTANLDIQ